MTMRKTFKPLPLVLALGAALAAPSVWADGLEYHGYVRAQAGGTSDGGNLQCFKENGALAKYRLGNECDNYSEHSVALPFGDTNGVWYKYKLTLAVQNQGKQDAESTNGNAMNWLHRENYFSAGGFFGRGALENASLWVGQRFYNRHDVHMNDYYYWTNNGTGAGIEEIQAGPVKLAFAYLQNGGNANAANDVVNKRYSVRFYDIDVNPGGKFEGEFVHLMDSTAATGVNKGSGDMLFLQHTQSGVLGGFNKLALVVGRDQGGAGFEWLPTYAGAGQQKDAKAWRIHEQLSVNFPGTGWSGTATAHYGKTEQPNNTGWSGNRTWTWMSFGVRPTYNFTKNFSLAAEFGHDEAKTPWGADAGKASKLDKLTIAPQLALSEGVWSRPVLRAFVTYAHWNDVARNYGIANGVFGTKNSGTTFGVQAEAWW
jgi:maltoporin